ncbi:transcription antitermination factor NusB [Anderseniella sp. Alg231-50]|uniref:transcription antitermination factor NusB n=1 Tax=Anderseniella sp. Alg231-50 TaxID=1922226 RepID=UPI000D55816F
MGVKKKKRARKFVPPPIEVEGLGLRAAALNAVSLVLYERRFLEEALSDSLDGIDDPRDRAFAHALAATALRRKGQIEAVLENYIEQKLRARTGRAPAILLCGVAQLLFMETEPHAAISTSVALAARDEKAQRLKGLINAVLRNISRDRDAIMAALPTADTNLPKWLNTRLRADYGPETTEHIADAHTQQADVDLTFRTGAPDEALLALGVKLPTGSVRLNSPHPAVPDLPGFADGNWWVQDVAASLPAMLFDDLQGKTALDMCSAPGGKTLQLCAAGATVTALDTSAFRLEKVTENLARTKLEASCVAIDALEFEAEQLFDVILLDAPCSATGTIRRHPDMPYVRGNDDVKLLLALQRKLLRKAATLLKPDGTLVYAVCSLLADEGPKQISQFLNEHGDFKRHPIAAGEKHIPADLISKAGDFRTLPHHMIGDVRGMDGFFAARLVKAAI